MLRFLPRTMVEPSEKELAALRPYEGVMAQLLYARGVRDAAAAEVFLHPGPEQLHDPFLLYGMKKAVVLLQEAKEKGISTVVFGDYDVDGMCAASILTDALRRFGLKTEPYIPLREKGYGLNIAAVEELSKSYGLMVTVDLGITNHEEVRLAQQLGMRVIVTDHHQLPMEDSPADAVVTPLLQEYPCPKLCGAGVAFKLAQALLGREEAACYLDLAALATVADIVPLTGENRVIVSLGLPAISDKKRPGLRSLMEVSGACGEADSYTLGFQLAPRLNAAGRLADANQGVRLLMTADEEEAGRIAKELNALNTRRKQMESHALAQAEEQAKNHDFSLEKALVVQGEGWHMGVIGLVAGRLSRKYACPTAALSQENGILHGSLRSVPGVNIHRCLQTCDDLLLKYGGHEQAAGVTLLAENYDAFCARLQAAVSAAAEEEAFFPSCEYDLPLSLGEATKELVGEIAALAPFGAENPPPLFWLHEVQLSRRRACGAEGAHLQLTLRKNGYMLDGIAFGMGQMAASLPDDVDAVVKLKWEEFRGVGAVKCEAEALSPAKGAAEKAVFRADEREFQTAFLGNVTKLLREEKKAGKTGEFLEIIKVIPWDAAEGFSTPSRGVLYVASARETALRFLKGFGQEVECAWHTTSNPLCPATLLVCPHIDRVSGFWHQVVLLDGETLPGEGRLWQERLPVEKLVLCAKSEAAAKLAAGIDAGDEAYRRLYKLLRGRVFGSLSEAADAAGIDEPEAQAGLQAFTELGLIRCRTDAFTYTLLPPVPCKLDDSPTLSALRHIAQFKEV